MPAHRLSTGGGERGTFEVRSTPLEAGVGLRRRSGPGGVGDPIPGIFMDDAPRVGGRGPYPALPLARTGSAMVSSPRRRLGRASRATWAALSVLANCTAQRSTSQRPTVPVTIASARRMAVPNTIVASGSVTPLQTAIVAPQVDGIVTAVAFREGQEVVRGQVLFQIEPQPYQAAYQQAIAARERDRATADNARREAERYSTLEQADYVTREQADQARAVAAAAQASVEADDALVRAAQFNLDRTTIRAPIAGRTGGLLVRAGNVVHAAGATPLVVIDQIEPILVRFAVPASLLPLLLQYGGTGLPVLALPGGAPLQGTADTALAVGLAAGAAPSASDAPSPARLTLASASGTLTFIDNAVDTTTGTIMLKATFANPTRKLWPGAFVTVALRLFTEQDALVVPSPAVLTGQQGTYVYVVDSQKTAQPRPVSVERTAGNMAVIASGLRDGEQVVVTGQSRLTPGVTVSVPTKPDSAAASPPAARRGP